MHCQCTPSAIHHQIGCQLGDSVLVDRIQPGTRRIGRTGAERIALQFIFAWMKTGSIRKPALGLLSRLRFILRTLAPSGQFDDATDMDPVAIVREYFAACEARDLARARALFAPDFTSTTASGDTFHTSTQLSNLKSFFEEYSNVSFSIHTMFACGDRVVTQYTHHLTHGTTGLFVDYARIVIHTIRDGLIVESAGVSDSLALSEAKTAIAAHGRCNRPASDAQSRHGD